MSNIKTFIRSSGIILIITAIAKIVSSLGESKILEKSDPVFNVSFRHLFWFVATIEIGAAIVCFAKASDKLKIIVIAWLGSLFLTYRVGLSFIGYQKPCPCLGTLTGALHMRPEIVDSIMKCVLMYMVIGSYTALIWLWLQSRRKFLSLPG